MKTKEELNALREEVEALRRQLAELTEDELAQVNGGAFYHYKVKFGDTLASIARYLGVSQSTLTALNGIRNPDKIYIGQDLIYPGK